jgi:hypothetical protein
MALAPPWQPPAPSLGPDSLGGRGWGWLPVLPSRSTDVLAPVVMGWCESCSRTTAEQLQGRLVGLGRLGLHQQKGCFPQSSFGWRALVHGGPAPGDGAAAPLGCGLSRCWSSRRSSCRRRAAAFGSRGPEPGLGRGDGCGLDGMAFREEGHRGYLGLSASIAASIACSPRWCSSRA